MKHTEMAQGKTNFKDGKPNTDPEKELLNTSINILSRDSVCEDGVRIGDSIY
jgi:hypothetical protein